MKSYKLTKDQVLHIREGLRLQATAWIENGLDLDKETVNEMLEEIRDTMEAFK